MDLRFYVLTFGPHSDPDSTKAALAKSNPEAVVQTLSAALGIGSSALELLAAQTLVAKGANEMLARKPEVDFLLRVAGTSQITRAIKSVGATKGKSFLLVLASEGKRGLTVSGSMGRPMARRPLNRKDMDSVEAGALLSARRA